MDDTFVRELLRSAESAGATDAALLSSNSVVRSDTLISGNTPKSSIKKNNTITFFAAVDNAEATASLDSSLPIEAAKQIVIQTTKAAKLANTWGSANSHIPFGRQLIKNSPQICPDRIPDPDNNPAPFDTCSKSAGSASCLENSALPFTSALAEIAKKISENSPEFSYNLQQITTDSNDHIWHSGGYQHCRNFTTTLSQEIVLSEGYAIKLPDYIYDGAGINTADPWHSALLSAAEIAQKLHDARQAPLQFKEYHGFGVLLSPWAVAVLAHESRHLGLDLTASKKITIDADSCLFTPPISPRSCPGFALCHALGNRPTLAFLHARTPSDSLMLDIPTRWSRKDTTLFVEFAFVASIENQKISKYFQPVTLQFDLSALWRLCTETAEPARRMAFPCIDSHTVIQAFWAYFNCRATPVNPP